MTLITFSTPTSASIDWIADHLCAEDVAELAASGYSEPLAAIKSSVTDSDESFVASWHGTPQCIFGVAKYPLDKALGNPWMLSTGNFKGVAREFMRVSRKWISDIEPSYGVLFNFVDVRHVRAQRWLMALGFKPLKAHDFNHHQFIEFGRFPACV